MDFAGRGGCFLGERRRRTGDEHCSGAIVGGLGTSRHPRDYHFAIQGATGVLWGRRRRLEPDFLAWFEYLNWLDIRLIQAFPDAVRDEYADGQPARPEFYGVSAFSNLISLYSREGFLHEAKRVAQLASHFGQGEQVLAELEERFAALRAEDGG
jgi:hypothetical protein